MALKNLLVLGGGTAGWFTALYLKNIFPYDNVVLIQSKEIGIIGVGEATTANVTDFLLELDINIQDIIRECDATFKNGISFENWNNDNKRYFHDFLENVNEFEITDIFNCVCYDYYLKNVIKKEYDLKKYLYAIKLSYENKIDVNSGRTKWALHFNANKLANYLEKVGKQRGIKVVEGIFSNATQDKDQFITSLNLKDGRSFNCDFVFDCSGFNRILVGNLFKEKWVSYSKHLPMKKAIPFWLDVDKNKIKPYTTATAMKYGWIWQIPLQSRIGSGYVFDSNYINENQALEEAEKFFNKKLEIRKVIDFNAGCYENFWVKNCMAVGLSSSFVEPLESTSLLITVTQLNIFKQFLNEIKTRDEHSIKLFNNLIRSVVDDVMNFIYIHYLTKRKDSSFWREFRSNNPMPDKIASLFDKIKSGNLRYFDLVSSYHPSSVFPLASYLKVCYGLSHFSGKDINIENFTNLKPTLSDYKNNIEVLTSKAFDHHIFIERLLDRN